MNPLSPQKDKFTLSEEVTFLNGAYMSPMMRSAEQAGIEAVSQKNNPFFYDRDSFFKPSEELRKTFSDLIGANDPDRIAIIPSASYGMANVANNIAFQPGEKIVMASEQFPSNVYPWRERAKETGAQVVMVDAPDTQGSRGVAWNEAIMEAIDFQTRVVTIGHIHWADGTLFDLKRIRAKTREVGALMIIDGTQSIGALPFDVAEFQPDAVICSAYKWLMGPYGIGMAYYGPYFDGGKPIENNWYARKNSDQFQYLINYQDEYRPKAARYTVGESSNFILQPILQTALTQVIEWQPARIQAYCKALVDSVVGDFQAMGCIIEDPAHRASHLFGIRLPQGMDEDTLKQIFQREKIYVSWRGPVVRVSPYLYNTKEDFAHLLQCFQEATELSVPLV